MVRRSWEKQEAANTAQPLLTHRFTILLKVSGILPSSYPSDTGIGIRARWTYGINFYRCRTIPSNSLVHDAAFLRGEPYASQIPATAIRVSTVREQLSDERIP